MTPDDYLNQTEKAIRQLFDSLRYYQGLLDRIEPQVFVTETEATVEEIRQWEEENREAMDRCRNAERDYFGQVFSNQTICGSILQIAARGISIYSNHTTIPTSCSSFITPSHGKVIPFCVGREVRSLPIGLIIYAGRNQYAHWDDQSLSSTNTKIFDIMSREHGYGSHLIDPSFDLTNQQLKIYSHNILAILGWRMYEDYISDMKDMICP